MKIERINENQIRCTLTSSDLSARNLNLGELAYGTEKAKKLFHEMIQKASNEVGFEADDIPLMVEAIPLSSESIMLIITKIEDPEELDTRFSRFSPGNEDEPLTALANEPQSRYILFRHPGKLALVTFAKRSLKSIRRVQAHIFRRPAFRDKRHDSTEAPGSQSQPCLLLHFAQQAAHGNRFFHPP